MELLPPTLLPALVVRAEAVLSPADVLVTDVEEAVPRVLLLPSIGDRLMWTFKEPPFTWEETSTWVHQFGSLLKSEFVWQKALKGVQMCSPVFSRQNS